MKQIISFLFVVIFSNTINVYAQKSYNLVEEYYQISIKGEIDNSSIKERRSYSFEDGKFISGQINVNGITEKNTEFELVLKEKKILSPDSNPCL